MQNGLVFLTQCFILCFKMRNIYCLNAEGSVNQSVYSPDVKQLLLKSQLIQTSGSITNIVQIIGGSTAV